MALRKLIHVVLSVFLIIPFIMNLGIYGISTTLYFTLITLIVSVIYVIQVKRPIITIMLLDALTSARRSILQQITKSPISSAIPLDTLDDSLMKLEKTVKELLDSVERDYERRGGYLGILMGAIGVLISQLLTGNYVIYGIISVIIYDTMSALGGTLLGRVKLPFSNATMEGALVGMASLAIVLFILTNQLIGPLAITVVAALAEAYGMEDNLAIPVTTSLIALVLKLPIIV
ncbi:phosphatidate cytidylyltransferase [Vulcanisaeta souniana JCM 11219]|uniref:Phosphatidate cytidylyltransferase n=2 Tax=Vulcanisaeta souniana TaxID=164452 RepID=A0A830EFS4_9CREN|nr:phosphatidate cytidylyltransferase [Vulcanisaeta souniana JCM 11219]GGI72560.1 phosphatidate cytidylyltransferase [Vulcanisaeta souniana JCM 11219]